MLLVLPEIIVIGVIVIIIGLALFYIIKSMKQGKKCIGCPYAKQCSGNKNKNNHKDCCCSSKEK